jgi:hypothetical protein
MNFMAVSSSSLGLALHFNPKRGGAKAQQTVIWAMKLAIISTIIAIVVRQFFPCRDLPQGDNPDGVRRFLDCTVRVTRMIDIPCGIFQCLTINRVPVREMKDVGIASG